MKTCGCGGSFVQTRFIDFDFSPYAGLPVFLTTTPGLVCSGCDSEVLEGGVIENALDAIAAHIICLPQRLTPSFVRFLRKYLGLSSRELAQELGIPGAQIHLWEIPEKKTPIPGAYDFLLRARALQCAITRRPMSIVAFEALYVGEGESSGDPIRIAISYLSSQSRFTQ